MRILVVDDEPDIVDLLADVCIQEGHQVVRCTQSQDALKHLARHDVDLLVADIAMPVLDGLELVRRARQLDPRVGAIVITGFAARYPMSEVLAAGASDLMIKPFRMEEFKARIALASQRRHQLSLLKERERGLQEISTEMIRGLQDELETARRMAEDARHETAPHGQQAR